MGVRSLVRYALLSLAGSGLAALIYKVPVEGTAFHELCRGAVLHDQNVVRIASGGVAVGNHPRSAPLHELSQSPADQLFALGIQIAGGLLRAHCH